MPSDSERNPQAESGCSVVPSSFRDPSGFVFRRDGVLYRQVNGCYREDFDALVGSGLLQTLQADGLLVPHEEADLALGTGQPYKVLRPQLVPFVSYPYEWCFGQLRAAALLTLELQERALARGLTLKDASAYNVQFEGGRPVFIDTLSFERYQPGRPWSAYRQFCQHFLAPLALMRYVDTSLSRLLAVHLDGVPLPLASRLLPFRTRLSFSLLAHLHWHASAQRRTRAVAAGGKVGLGSLRGLIDDLRSTVEGLRAPGGATTWSDYYDTHLYSQDAFAAKQAEVQAVLDQVQPRSVWDLGANEGRFGRMAAERGLLTVAFDFDHGAVQQGFVAAAGERRAPLTLVMDLTNPSPALGWGHAERDSLLQRGPADLVLALALVHHLAIGNNVPLSRFVQLLATAGRNVLVEFVPKDDPQVVRMLSSREDVFPDYSLESLERELGAAGFAVSRRPLAGSSRVLVLGRRG